jgi:hypothetical protein
MSREDFTNFLSTLPQRRFRYEGEAVPTVVSELIDSLEYRLENLFYEVGFGEQNDEYADAVIVSQITASLQLVIEVRPRSINRAHSRNSYPEKLVDDFQAI